MRLEDIAPRTLALAVVAAWAGIAWLLALSGMGSALPEGESGSVAAPPIPSLPAGAAPALGPLPQYGGIAERPLFALDRRPHPFVLDGEGGAAEAAQFDLVLTSVLITPRTSLAILQKPDGSESFRVQIGEAPAPYPGWRLVALRPRSADLEGPEGRRTLELRVFDGQGGSPPGVSQVPGGMPPVPPPVAPPGSPVPVPEIVPVQPQPGAVPPATDASTPDPAQIEAIRRRIEARREQMRQRARTPTPPGAPPTPVPAESK